MVGPHGSWTVPKVECVVGKWNDKSILITGCAGLVGCSLARRLVDSGANTIGLEHRDLSPEEPYHRMGLGENVTLVRSDLKDIQCLQRIMTENEIEVIFHLAAQSQVTVANDHPAETFDVNVRGTWNLLEAARRTNPEIRVLLISSDAVYGSGGAEAFTEHTVPCGQYPYEVSKICAERIGTCYQETYGLPVGIVRASNIYGPGDRNVKRLVPGTILSVLAGQRPQIRGNGKSLRDMLYVEDAVDSLMTLANALGQDDFGGDVFNVSSGSSVSVLEIVQLTLELMGRKDLAPEMQQATSGEAAARRTSSEKIRQSLGWSPRFSLADGLKKTIEWYR